MKAYQLSIYLSNETTIIHQTTGGKGTLEANAITSIANNKIIHL
jgi:hypothetical protein